MLTVASCRWFLSLSLIGGGGASALAASSAGKLLDETIRAPGRWSQMCAAPAPVSFDVPLPLYSLLAARFHSVSETNLERLRKSQIEIGIEIESRLGKFQFSITPKQNPETSSPTESNQDPNQLTGLLLQIILELKLVETLPQLMRIEQDLNNRLASATGGSLSALPSLDSDSPLMWKGMDFSSTKVTEEKRLFTARIFQRELLAVMAALLRQKRFQPMLDSDYETRYHDYLKRAAESEELRRIKTPADVPPDETRWITFDPVYQLPVRRSWLSAPSMPYSQEVRSQIRRCVAEYIAQTSNSRGSAQRQ